MDFALLSSTTLNGLSLLDAQFEQELLFVINEDDGILVSASPVVLGILALASSVGDSHVYVPLVGGSFHKISLTKENLRKFMETYNEACSNYEVRKAEYLTMLEHKVQEQPQDDECE